MTTTFSIDMTTTFPEVNGLEKEGQLQHNVVFQLMRLAQFWTSLYNIQITREINADNNVKVMKYIFPDEKSFDDFLAHSGDNGVDLNTLFMNYKAEIEALGGTLVSNIGDVLNGTLKDKVVPSV